MEYVMTLRATTYQRRAAVIEAYRRGRFFYWDSEDVRSRYESYISSDDLMEGQLSQHMRAAYSRFGSRLETPTFPLIRALAAQKAVAFRDGARVELVDPATGAAVSAADVPVVARLDRIIRDTGLEGAMARADEYMVTHHTAAVWIRLGAAGRLAIRTLPPYCLTVEGHPLHPGDAAIARRIVVPEAGDEYPEGETPEVRISYEYAGGGYYAGAVGPDGEPLDIELPETLTGAMLRVQAHPVIIWREEDAGAALAPLPKGLLHAQESVNRLLAETQLAFRAGAHGQRYLRKARDASPFPDQAIVRTIEEYPSGLDESSTATIKVGNTSVAIAGGVESLPVVPDGWELAMLQSQVDPVNYMRYVEAHIKLAFAAEDMVVSRIDLFNPQPSNYSGRAKLVDASPLEDARQRRERRLSELAERTLAVWASYWNLVADPADRIPAGLSWRVRFPGAWAPGILTDQSYMQGLALAFDAGLTDPAEVVASMRGISQDEARAQVARSAGTVGRRKQYATRQDATR